MKRFAADIDVQPCKVGIIRHIVLVRIMGSGVLAVPGFFVGKGCGFLLRRQILGRQCGKLPTVVGVGSSLDWIGHGED